MQTALRMVLGGLLLVPVVAWTHEPDLQREHDAAVTQKLLERVTQDHEQCKKDWAEIWVQARQLSIAYQRQDQELKALKQGASQEAPPAPEPKPPGNGTTP